MNLLLKQSVKYIDTQQNKQMYSTNSDIHTRR